MEEGRPPKSGRPCKPDSYLKVIAIASENPEGFGAGLRNQYWKFQVSPDWMAAPLELGIPNPGPPERELEMSTENVPAVEICPRSFR